MVITVIWNGSPQTAFFERALLKEALRSGQFKRGQASRITGLPARTAQRVLQDIIAERLLASTKPKGPVALRFPAATLESLFPRLYSES